MRIVAPITLTIVAIFTLVGCSAAKPTTNPYSDRIKEAQAEATSDFERQVLDDGELTRAEYEEAVNRYVECMEAQSIQISPVEQSGYYVFSTSTASSQYDAANDQCRPGTIGLIETLYVDMTMNPDNRPFGDIVVECLVARGAVEDGFSADDLKAEESRGGPVTETEDYAECMANPVLAADEG